MYILASVKMTFFPKGLGFSYDLKVLQGNFLCENLFIVNLFLISRSTGLKNHVSGIIILIIYYLDL